MAHRLEVSFTIPDTRAMVRKKGFGDFPFAGKIGEVFMVDVYTIDRELRKEDLQKVGEALINPVVQTFTIDKPLAPQKFDYAMEIGFLPGVTDNIGTTTKELMADLLKLQFAGEEAVYTSQLTFIAGDLSLKEAQQLADSFYNPLIQRVILKSRDQFVKEGGMGIIVPKVELTAEPTVDEVDLEISDEELGKLGKLGIANSDGTRRGPLALDLDYLRAIRDYFREKNRKPTDIELETLAQTWSEHCKHTIFSSQLDDIQEGIYKRYIQRATNEIRKAKGKNDFCLSVFKDNSGGIKFDNDWIITHKVETHNSPSALDPFGGSVTGIVGVNRDCIGFGKSAKPVANFYGFCLADPDDKEPLFRDKALKNKMLSPRRILNGVVAGVNAGGNQSGIPTPAGFLYFNDGYKGKPLVFVGTVGLIPMKVCGELGFVKGAKPGDLVVVVGGRVGQDGIHGATFSSEALDTHSPATAVQIGDAITQKKFSDAIVKEARELCLFHSITDNGAGGLSSSVGEMAKESGGVRVELDKAPLKYPNLQPWQIWISESQERMTLAVPPDKVDQFMDLMKRRGVEATVIGQFTDSGKCEVSFKGKMILDMDLAFLHDGAPEKSLKSEKPKVVPTKILKHDCPLNLSSTLIDMIGRLNICSHEFTSYQFDYVVQGQGAIHPLQGKGKVNGDGAVFKPVLSSNRGVVMAYGLAPGYSDFDAYHMAAASIDCAVRSAIALGVNPDHLALLDNFCWCSPYDPKRLYQLKEAARACFDYALIYGTPYISGKDSMFNDFSGFDKNGQPIKISIPPTLLISSIGVIDDITKAVTMDVKMAGDLIYILGETKNELGGSEYESYVDKKIDDIAGNVPQVDGMKANNLYRALHSAIEAELIVSAYGINFGGLGVALSKIALAGQLGLDINLKDLPRNANVDYDDVVLFSETQSRLIVTIAPENKSAFEKMMKGYAYACIGKVMDEKKLIVNGLDGKNIVHVELEELDESYRKRFKDY